MLELLAAIFWLLPDFVSIAQAAQSLGADERAFEGRLAAFSAAALARRRPANAPLQD